MRRWPGAVDERARRRRLHTRQGLLGSVGTAMAAQLRRPPSFASSPDDRVGASLPYSRPWLPRSPSWDASGSRGRAARCWGGWVTVKMNGGTTTARGPRSLRRTGWPELTPGVSAWPVQRPAAARRSQPVRPVGTWRRSTTSPATRREAEAGELGQKASARTRESCGERGVGERLEWDGSR